MLQKLLTIMLSLLITQATLAKDIDTFTKSMVKQPGFLTFFWDDNAGKVYIELSSTGEEILYVNSLASGVGSNDLSLDRGQLGEKRVVKFVRSGPKVMLQQPNLDYRAISTNPLEVKAVEEAFASSILWGFTIAAESKNRILIDVTDFLLRDSHNIKRRLADRKQGNYSVDASRSAVYLPRSKNFQDNTELEVTLTLKGTAPGHYLSSVTPTPELVTVRTHHSFIRLPDNNYKPRAFDPRTGQFYISYQDYAAPLGTSMTKRLLVRHRLNKKDPTKALSEVEKPIIYYLDPGVPEPVRSALREGASWWKEAFEAAGFKNAFKVEMLPDDADPMDVRYNTIQWVHRSTRGWSYGDSIIDPRTGEILKGHVTLGSLRVRQDMLIAQGLTSPFVNGDEVADELKEMALARLRQLAAHEVGHTLGLTHNFAASPDNRASVMDYPHPFIELDENGKIVLQNAYAVGIAEWDKLSIAYGYSEFSDGEFPEQAEKQGLAQILQRIADSGLQFITDQDSRAGSMAHPAASLWDNGKDPAEELARVLDIRRSAMTQFGNNTIKNGTPWSELEKILVPVYLFHRYQSDATAKVIGGVNYAYGLKGDATKNQSSIGSSVQVSEVSPDNQKRALDIMLRTLSSQELAIPINILRNIPPPAYGYDRNRESFKSSSKPSFDALSAVETAASHSLHLLLHPARAVRLVQQKAHNSKNIGLSEVQMAIIDNSWKKSHKDSYQAAVQGSINWTVLKAFFQLAETTDSTPQVRAITLSSLRYLAKWLAGHQRGSATEKAMNIQAAEDIRHFLDSEQLKVIPPTKPLPPGSPIG